MKCNAITQQNGLDAQRMLIKGKFSIHIRCCYYNSMHFYSSHSHRFQPGAGIGLSVIQNPSKNTTSEFPDVLHSLKHSLQCSFREILGVFCVKVSGNSGYAFTKAPSMEKTDWSDYQLRCKDNKRCIEPLALSTYARAFLIHALCAQNNLS